MSPASHIVGALWQTNTAMKSLTQYKYVSLYRTPLTWIFFTPDTFRRITPDRRVHTRYTGKSVVLTTYTPATFQLKSGIAGTKWREWRGIKLATFVNTSNVNSGWCWCDCSINPMSKWTCAGLHSDVLELLENGPNINDVDFVSCYRFLFHFLLCFLF